MSLFGKIFGKKESNSLVKFKEQLTEFQMTITELKKAQSHQIVNDFFYLSALLSRVASAVDSKKTVSGSEKAFVVLPLALDLIKKVKTQNLSLMPKESQEKCREVIKQLVTSCESCLSTTQTETTDQLDTELAVIKETLTQI